MPMYKIDTEILDHMKRQIPCNTACFDEHVAGTATRLNERPVNHNCVFKVAVPNGASLKSNYFKDHIFS